MRKAVLLAGIFGFGNVDEVELAPHRQRDPQCMHKCFDAHVGEIGWMDDGLEPMWHGGSRASRGVYRCDG